MRGRDRLRRNALFWWGERNKQNNWDNLTFDGGFGGAGNNVPLGWTPDATFFAGGAIGHHRKSDVGRRVRDPGRRRDGDARADDADRRERLQRSAATRGQHRILGARARAHDRRADAGHAARAHFQRVTGNFHDRHFRARGANHCRRVEGIHRADYAGAGICCNSRRSAAARVRRRHAHSGAGFLVENIEIFPTATPYNTSLVRASFAEDPESYDGVTGFMSVSENDGQTVRAAFLLRERLYLVKDRSHARHAGRWRE